MESLVRLRREDDGVAVVTLDHPPVNVLNLPMMQELSARLEELERDTAVKLVLLRGAGRAFCAGVDVADHTRDRVASMLRRFHDVLDRILRLEPPVVAAVGGAALGGGCELALACDVVLASGDARLGQPEITLGVFPPAAAVLLPRLVGRQRALELVLSGRVLAAGEAAAMGLVSRILPAVGFEAAVEEWVHGLAALSRPVLRMTKRAVTQGLDRSLAEAMRSAEDLYLDGLMSLQDPHEGLAAFLEKRRPVWKDA